MLIHMILANFSCNIGVTDSAYCITRVTRGAVLKVVELYVIVYLYYISVIMLYVQLNIYMYSVLIIFYPFLPFFG
jgi:hypothetical protein